MSRTTTALTAKCSTPGSRTTGSSAARPISLGGGLLSAGWQSDFGRDIERPRNNSRTVRFYYPTEDSHRLTVGYDLRDSAASRA